jgi:hypothetical protein
MDVIASIEELIPGSISTDAVLPSQYAGRSAEAALCGELRLMSAVLEDAIGIYLSYRSSNRKPGARLAFNEARTWLVSSSRIGPFAFLNLCDALGIEAGKLRVRLKALRIEIEKGNAHKNFHRARADGYGNSNRHGGALRAGARLAL